MKIRAFEIKDTEAIKHITAVCFDGVSIDQNLEKQFGLIDGHNWQFRKLRQIDNDIAENAAGIFVAEVDDQLVGYVTTRIDKTTKVGKLPNLGVLPGFQQHGIGRTLINKAIEYVKTEGMKVFRIETMVQNAVGLKFYPKMGFTEVARQVHYAMDLCKDES